MASIGIATPLVASSSSNVRMSKMLLSIMLLLVCFGVVYGKNTNDGTSFASWRTKRQSDIGQRSCDSVQRFFQSKNITLAANHDTKGNVCGGHCCDSDDELTLKELGKKDFATLLRDNTRSLLGPITRIAHVLQNHIWELARQSENKTVHIFSQVYQDRSVLSRESIETLYRDIRDYVKIEPIDQKPSKTPEDIVQTVEKFFTDLFPLAYHHQTLSAPGDFTVKYKQCLKDNVDVIVPFGDYPKQVADTLSKSLETMRVLLQALNVGVEVLNATDALIIDEQNSVSSECHAAILKMTYCPKCLGLMENSKPCSGYCLNVLRGCVSKYVTELEMPWNSYVEGVEKLVNAVKRTSNEGIDAAIRNLDNSISSAIMYCMEKIVDIDKKVKMTCKIAEFTQKVESLTAETSTVASAMSKARQPSLKTFPPFPDAHINSFLSTMSKTRGFYAELADNLCDESFAEQRDKKCWNGERIAEYTKTIVAATGGAQKYNPEVKASPDLQQIHPKIANLVDKLRHVHHLAVSSLGPNHVDTDDMQRDGAEGSGSGVGPDFDDADDESRGSGSGHGPTEPEVAETPIEPRLHDKSETFVPVDTKTSGGDRSAVTLKLFFAATLVLIWRY